MQATKIETISYHGQIVSQEATPDHATRIKAADSWANLTGVSANKASMGGNGGPTDLSITFNVPWVSQVADMMERERDVTPLPPDHQGRARRWVEVPEND